MNFSSTRIQPELRLKLDGLRSRIVLVLIMAGFAGLIGRAFFLQGLDNNFLQAKGEARFARVVDMPASRGAVMDRNGKPLAISTPVESIWASPVDMEIEAADIVKLSNALLIDKKILVDKLADKEKSFVWLKRQLSPEQAAKVMSMRLPGIFQQREYRRFYPQGDVTAHVIGFTGMDDNGLEGIERAHQALLSGTPGQRKVIKDRKGRIVEDMESAHLPHDGQALKLALDERLQYIAHRELKAAVESNKAKGGALVMLDAKTGEVLAMVNFPDFNPNNRVDWDVKQARNRSVTDTFEPGSTFKPFAIAAGLEAGIVTPDTVIQIGPSYALSGHTIKDSHVNDSLTVAGIIQHSSNIGTLKIALQLPNEQLWNLYNELGFGLTPATGFPGEAAGHLRAVNRWQPIDKATMSYGYGVSVSLLQLARAYTLFTNDGVLLPVSFMRREGDVIGKQIISAKTAHQLSQMMETVTELGGTAIKAQVPGYRVAGKTGTAYKLVNGKYSENLYLGSFVGYGPVSKPRYILAVTIDEPSAGKYYGGDVAAPVFSNVMAQAMRQADVPPDAGLHQALALPLVPLANTPPGKG